MKPFQNEGLIMTLIEFDKHCAKVEKLKALAERPGTEGEKIAAEAALDRIEPFWRMTDEELLDDLLASGLGCGLA